MVAKKIKMIITVFLCFVFSQKFGDEDVDIINLGENVFSVVISPREKKANELITKRYSDSELLEITRAKMNMMEFAKTYPMECIRRDNQNLGYRVTYFGKNGIAKIDFNSDGIKYWCHGVVKEPKERREFDNVRPGLWDYEDVMALDPFGDFTVFYTSYIPKRLFSYHCTSDGYLITIEYDSYGVVIKIDCELL